MRRRTTEYVHHVDWENDFGLDAEFEIAFSVDPGDRDTGCGPNAVDMTVRQTNGVVPGASEAWDWDEFVDWHEHKTGQTEDQLIDEMLDAARDSEDAYDAQYDTLREKWEAENV